MISQNHGIQPISNNCCGGAKTRVSISWLYSCNKSSYIRFVYSQYHVDWLKCTEQNVNNPNLTQVSQLYVYVSFCLKVIRSWHYLPTGGHGHVICMLDMCGSCPGGVVAVHIEHAILSGLCRLVTCTVDTQVATLVSGGWLRW